MEIHLTKDAVVDQRTGAVETPSEYLDNLRGIEVGIARADEEISSVKAHLKAVKDKREELVAQLRSAVRDGKVLPLFEALDHDDDGLGVDDTKD